MYPTIKRLALALPKEFAYTRLQTLARTKETDDMDHEMLFGEYEIVRGEKVPHRSVLKPNATIFCVS